MRFQFLIFSSWMRVLTGSHQPLENADDGANAFSSIDPLRPSTQAPSGGQTPDLTPAPPNATEKEPHRR